MEPQQSSAKRGITQDVYISDIPNTDGSLSYLPTPSSTTPQY